MTETSPQRMHRTASFADRLMVAPWGVVLLLALGCGAVYASALPGDLVWDDFSLVREDARLDSLSNVGEIFSHDFFDHGDDELAYGYYRPMVTASYLVEVALHGRAPLGFHLTNLLLHLGVCLLVWRLASRVLGDARAALMAALLFAVHPIHTESVSWIAGRTDVLATLLALGAWLAHLRALDPDRAPVVRMRTRLALRALAALLFFAALLAKEMAVAMPAALAMQLLHRHGLRRALRESWPYVLVLGAYLGLRFGVVHVPTGVAADHGLLVHVASVATSFFRYLTMLVWPWPLRAYIQNAWTENIVLGLVAVGALAGVIALGWRYRRARFGWLSWAFLLSFVPLANIIRISSPEDMGFTIAERFLYWPSIFFCLALGGLLVKWPRHAQKLLPGLGALCLVFGATTSVRGYDYRDETRFFEAAATHVDAPLVLGRLGVAYALDGRRTEAVDALERARVSYRRQYDEDDHMLAHDLGNAYRLTGRPTEALAMLWPLRDVPAASLALGDTLRRLGRSEEAGPYLRRALSRHPRSLESLLAMGKWEAVSNRLEQARRHFARARDLFPDALSVDLAEGDALIGAGQADAALSSYRRGLERHGQEAAAEAALGTGLARVGHADEARAHLVRALELEPRLDAAETTLAILDAQAGALASAEERLRRVIARSPEDATAGVNLALVLRQRGDDAGAAAEAAHVLELQPGEPRATQLLHSLGRGLR